MPGKPQPNHKLYIELIRRMAPAQRHRQAIDLSETSRELFRSGLRLRHPDLNEAALHVVYLQRLARCHNSNY